MKVKVKYIPNILSVDRREERTVDIAVLASTSVRTVLDASGFDYHDHRIIANSRRVEDLQNEFIPDNSIIIITPDIQIAAIAGAAKFVWAKFIEHWVTWTVAILSTSYSVYSALSAPKAPAFNSLGEGLDEGSPTYSWNGVQTTQDIGIPIPVIYGENKVGGNTINQFVSTDGDKNYLNMLLAICEGESESISSIKINDNPIANFSGVSQTSKMGTSDQDVIPNFEDLHNEYSVNSNLTKDNPYVYTTVNDDVEAFEIKLLLPNGLFRQDSDTGAIKSWSVTYQVEYKLVGAGSYTDLGTTTISGKSRSALRRIYRKDGLTAGQYDIRVTRTSGNSSLDPNKTGDLTFYSLDEIQTDDLKYPNTALLGLELLATDQLSGATPNVTMVVKGRKVSVPDVQYGGEAVDWEDYYWDPSAEEYKRFEDDAVCSWDGSSYVDLYSANPIWCIKDLLLDDRYGLGDYINTDHITAADWVTMSRICEEQVQDGEGGYEKLYRLDVVIDSKTKALDLLVQLAQSFDAFVFYSEGAINFKIDEDDDVVQIFGMGNIVANSMRQSWKSKREKYNMIHVQYIDQDKDYSFETVTYMDDSLVVSGEPIREKTIRVYVNKKSYALRAARRALKVSQNINRTLQIGVGIDALAVTPGDAIGFSHDVPQIGFSGRIESGSTTTSVNVDQEITIEAGKTYKLIIQFADDTIEERTVSNAPGTTDTITVSSAFSQAPAAYDKYALGEEDIHYKKFRVLGVTLDENLDAVLTAIEMSSNVYDYTAPVIPQDNYSALSREIPDVENLELTETLRKAKDGTIFNTINVWFKKPDLTSHYVNTLERVRVYLSDDDGDSWIYKGETKGESFFISDDILDGSTYKVAVVGVDWQGKEAAIGDSPQATIGIVGKAAEPSDVSGFVVRQSRDRLYMTWSDVSDADLSGYEIRYGTSWEAGTVLATQVSQTHLYSFLIKLGDDQSYWIKAIDTSGNYSETATEAVVTVENVPFTNIIEEYEEETDWSGTKSNTETDGDNLIISSGHLSGTYTCPVRDVGFVATFKVGIEAVATVSADDTWQDFGDDTFADMPDTARFSGGEVAGALAFEIKTSDDNITWSDWAVWTPGDYTCRYFQLRMTMTRESTSQDLECSQLEYYADLPDVDDFGEAEITVAADGIEVTFNKEFHKIPSVNIDILSGDGYLHKFSVVPDLTDFTVKLYDLDGVAQTGTLRWSAHGV